MGHEEYSTKCMMAKPVTEALVNELKRFFETL